MQTKTNKKTLAPGASRGFTLIEMLVVIGIIGLLSSMILISVSRIRKNSIDTRRKANIENVRGAISMYYSVKNQWPTATTWSDLITALSSSGYLSDSIKADEDDDGSADYTVCSCAVGCSPACSSGSQMRLSGKCEISDGEGCTDTVQCNSGWTCLEVK